MSETEDDTDKWIVDHLKSALINFSSEILPTLLNCTCTKLQSTLVSTSNSAQLRQFFSDQSVKLLIINKETISFSPTVRSQETLSEKDGSNHSIDVPDDSKYTLNISCELNRKALNGPCVAILKKDNVNFLENVVTLLSDKDQKITAAFIASRVRIFSLGNFSEADDGAPLTKHDSNFPDNKQLMDGIGSNTLFGEVINFLQYIVDPILITTPESVSLITPELYLTQDSPGDAAFITKKNLLEARQKLAELLVALQQLQQNSEVPVVQLNVEKVIVEYMEKCKEQGTEFSPNEFIENLGENSSLVISQLQQGVQKWNKEIQKVLILDRDPKTGSASDEIQFWLNMEQSLTKISQQIKSPNVEATFVVLQTAKKLALTLSFEKDTGLKNKLENVQNINLLMRDFPINDLLSARSVNQLLIPIRHIFNHLRRLKHVTQYSFERAFQLCEAVSRDLNQQLYRILSAQRLMTIPFEEFDLIFSNCLNLSRAWEDGIRSFKDMVRDLMKRRTIINVLPPKFHYVHTLLLNRINEIRCVRFEHQKLKDILSRVLPLDSNTDSHFSREVSASYIAFQNIDPLDMSRAGIDQFNAAKKQYANKIDRVESEISNVLRDRLGAAKTGTEMFRIFSQFNPLFFRPRIQSAIQQYQATLIEQVGEDLKGLQIKFKRGFEASRSYIAGSIWDIPETCGKVIWYRQLEKKVQECLNRMEDALGKAWEQHVDGKNLRVLGYDFLKKLNSQAIFDSWIQKIKVTKDFNFRTLRLFNIIPLSGKEYTLGINYDPDAISFFKEVRCFISLGIRVPYSVKLAAEETKWIYPYYMTLRESIFAFIFASQRLKKPELQYIVPLTADFQSQIYELLHQGFKLTWDSDNIALFTTTLCKKVNIFEAKLEELESLTQEINELLESISIIPFKSDTEVFVETHSKIQGIVTQLYLQDYVNLEQYVNHLNLQLENTLLRRLYQLIDQWISEFTCWPFSGSEIIKKGSLHAFKFTSGRLCFYPPVEVARQLWINNFYQTLGWVCRLPKFVASEKFDTSVRSSLNQSVSPNLSDQFFDHLLQRLPNKLSQALGCIEKTISNLSDYVEQWLKYQYLWQVELSTFASTLGDDLSLWQKVLSEIRAFRSMFDMTEEKKIFGPIVVDYGTAQQKIIRRFETYHREFLGFFGTKLSEHARQFLNLLQREVELLESEFPAPKILNLNDYQGLSDAQKLSILSQITDFVVCVKSAKTKTSSWGTTIRTLETGEKLLERHCYSFPSNWCWVDSIISEWEKFQQLAHHNYTLLERNHQFFKKFVSQQSKDVQDRLSTLYGSWTTLRPLDGTLSSSKAFQILARFEEKVKEIREEFDQINQVQESLEMNQIPSEVNNLIYSESSSPDQFLNLNPSLIENEINCLTGVWSELSKLYTTIDELRETQWSTVSPKKLRMTLTMLVEDEKKIPAKYRQYEVFENLQAKLQHFLECNKIITDLQSEALKDRHWKRLLDHLGLRNTPLGKLTLGNVWDSDLTSHEVEIQDILLQAQGESALEEFLAVVKTTWSEYELCLYVFKNRCKLIKGWDQLFSLLDDHMNSIQSMKLSPYYKTFQEEATTWDEKLSRVRGLVESWVEVQRKWVYLEGVFTDSADIKSLLPNEFSRFCSVDRDFLSIMKKTATRPMLLELSSTDGLQRSLDRISDLLSKIQRALGDYLERQRFEFPRFYFVGDEDLLEMIGNSKNVKMVQRHCSKMFSGISTFKTDDDTDTITMMASKEGEEVKFTTPICIANYASLNSWLHACEKEMQITLAALLDKVLKRFASFNTNYTESEVFACLNEFPCQILLLCLQIEWTALCTSALQSTKTEQLLPGVLDRCVTLLNILSNRVIYESDKLCRLKILNLITEIIHQRELCQSLIINKVSRDTDFLWLQCMRFYYNSEPEDATKRVTVRIGSAMFSYGFEYLGVQEKLVQTSLTDRCFFTLTQALHLLFGGNPFGPAGTGKTETVKALGHQLGRFVLVFCCDESFDFQAVGRIFVGLCQVGAWGCFDEFNRLEERILSACSEHILTIQTGLRKNKNEIELLNQTVPLNHNIRIFVTMNPGYAGRSNLPDNLKQLFREVAMVNPDKAQIAEVLLYSQGFHTAELLAGKVVCLFELCQQQLSSQAHYDFGLRALKNVLSSAGILKQLSLVEQEQSKKIDQDLTQTERTIVIQSICNTLVPKLAAKDIPLLRSLIQGVFPQEDLYNARDPFLEDEVRRLCQLRYFDCSPSWMEKVLQLYQIQKLSHGIMLVGSVGSGKTAVWTTLLEAMELLDGIKGQSYVLDPKCGKKDALYGRLDPTTLEWTDGIFTSILRKIIDSVQGGLKKRHWIVFDGDVDPEWAENLNSVLDDNKLLTLPNGERLELPSCVRILFEVDDLQYATLATVSRCGMVSFNETVLSITSITSHFLQEMKYSTGEPIYSGRPFMHEASTASLSRSISNHPEFFEGATNRAESSKHRFSETAQEDGPILPRDSNDCITQNGSTKNFLLNESESNIMSSLFLKTDGKQEPRVQWLVSDILLSFFEPDGFVTRCIKESEKGIHIMEFTTIRIIHSMFCLIRKHINQLVEFRELNGTCDVTHIEKYTTRILLYCICWGCGGSMISSSRVEFARKVANMSSVITLPQMSDNETLLDFYVNLSDAEWYRWQDSVTSSELDPLQAQDTNLIVETVDTVRHRNILSTWIEQKMSFILCGPAGSGKTMTLTTTLKSLGDVSIAFLNFSSGTSSEVLLKTFDHYCEYAKTTSGMILRPSEPGKWLIVFADEINLPQPDQYNTQRVIMFIRQIQENGGFWKMIDSSTSHWCWVKLERILFAGACNPPTDAGRHPMSRRFLRHAPLLFVDFPCVDSLLQIYGSMNKAILSQIPSLDTHAYSLTKTMVSFYLASQGKFTTDLQPHYIYSPRELTRWKSALQESLTDWRNITFEEFIRLVVHEGLRIFQDRLVEEEERQWTDKTLDEIVIENFPESRDCLNRPIIFCNYLTQTYRETSRENLRGLMENRLKQFNEEQLNVQLVFFDQFLDNIIRTTRVLQQPLGHLLLVGASGVGKTVLSKFVSWMNGLEAFQIKAGQNYNTAEFEMDLRTVMKRAGIRKEKITFIFDESNALGPAFIERMNALLANGEVPGLFEGDDLVQLISEIRQSDGAKIGQEDQDLFAYFTKQVQRNLHIIFTMNPANSDFRNCQASSPALFNRCVVNWFGDWSHHTLLQVGYQLTKHIDLPCTTSDGATSSEESKETLAVTIVSTHEEVVKWNDTLKKNAKKHIYLTPRDFLDFIKHLINLISEKENERLDTAKHLSVGLTKVKETEVKVEELQQSLAVKNVDLQMINTQAEEKMLLIVKQQAIAEERKKDVELLAADLDSKATLMSRRRLEVGDELKLVEPLLREAEAAVSNIPKRNLDELRAMANPPQMVKFAVEAVVVMLNNMGMNPTSWEECRKTLKAGDFISRVVTFDSMNTSPITVQRIKQKYLDTDNWDVDKIMRASKAAGPLAIWVQSSIDFQVIVQKVEPLREEIETLKEESSINAHELKETQAQIADLEKTLENYKKEYAQLITEVERIRQEIAAVQNKVKRSSHLLTNLASEKQRWSSAYNSSKNRVVTVIGDCILAAGFTTYLGFFEHRDRTSLISLWKNLLSNALIPYNPNLSLVEYLSKPSQRYKWRSCALPDDKVSMENAIILHRYIRYPLVIDPSGQAISFILNSFSEEKIIKTSLTDLNFFKTLESALRFGTPLLLQDVEKVDPILNSVLNRETHKMGGRTLITVGDSEIDFSPTFQLFLITRNPTARFSPDVCSRVTFVNFTLTPSSLQNQFLNILLKFERPDIDQKRSDLLKLQGEYQIRLRELEDSLLHSLSNVKGNILDDQNLVEMLETLKAQAAEVEQEAASANAVMVEVEKVSNIYFPLSEAASRIYFTLQCMHYLKFFYRYDLVFFETVFLTTLTDPNKTKNSTKGDVEGHRLNVLTRALFKNVFLQCSFGLTHEDSIVFGLELARIYAVAKYGTSIWANEFELLLQSGSTSLFHEQHSSLHQQSYPDSKVEHMPESEPMESQKTSDKSSMKKDFLDIITPEQKMAVELLTKVPVFSDVKHHMKTFSDSWKNFLESNKPELCIPLKFGKNGATPLNHNSTTLFPGTTKPPFQDTDSLLFENEGVAQAAAQQCLWEALIIKVFRLDALFPTLVRFIQCLFGPDFTEIPPFSTSHIRSLILNQLKPGVPLILITSPGFDPSAKLASLASEYNEQLTSIAMGSEEGYTQAEKAIRSAAVSGTWLLLKNAHLSPTWILDLEKLLFQLKFHNHFRIFLTMEVNEKISPNFFRISFTFYFEPPIGLRASLQRAYTQFFTTSDTEKAPSVARNRLFFLLAFLHSVILERRRYTPHGWSKAYEFSDSDLLCGIWVLREYMDNCSVIFSASSSAKKQTSYMETIDPADIPFDAIRTLLKHLVYGGRLDNYFDARTLSSLIDHLFSPDAFKSDFVLAQGNEQQNDQEDGFIPPLIAPDLSRFQNHYFEFISTRLEQVSHPVWLGLVPQADRFISASRGKQTLEKWHTLLVQSSDALNDFSASVKPKVDTTLTEKSIDAANNKAVNIPDEIQTISSRSNNRFASLLSRSLKLLESLPPSLHVLKSHEDSVNDPLFRYFERETVEANKLLHKIETSLFSINDMCAGRQPHTSAIRDLCQKVENNVEPPKEWLPASARATTPTLTLSDWLLDFCRRVAQLAIIGSAYGGGSTIPNHELLLKYKNQVLNSILSVREYNMPIPHLIWLGGLQYPAAFLNATRQYAAQHLRMSLDDLEATLHIGEKSEDIHDFYIGGVTVENASWDSNLKSLVLSDVLVETLPLILMKWRPREKHKIVSVTQISVPVFLTETRSELITTLELPIYTEDTTESASKFYQRGVALILWRKEA